MTSEHSKIWKDVGALWPDPVQLRRLGRLEGFPYSPGYFRNLCTGQAPDPDLKAHVFHIGKMAAIRKKPLLDWLARKTRS